MPDKLEVAIIGAGPYGLSIGAHLNHRKVDCRVFGEPMITWRTQMPENMLLKSDGFASNLSEPTKEFTLQSYCHQKGIPYHDLEIPVPLQTFIDYASGFQRSLVTNIDNRSVRRLTGADDGFTLRLCDDQMIQARRVVVAAGIGQFAHVPNRLSKLPLALVSHSSAHRNVQQFADKAVAVIGAGSSAAELAALLHENGAKVQMVVRKTRMKFGSPPGASRWKRLQQIRHPQSGLGPGIRSKLACEFPDLFRVLPPMARLGIVRQHLGPASAWHLKSRVVGHFPILLGHDIADVGTVGDRIRLSLITVDGHNVTTDADHVIAATGYRADISRLQFIDEGLRSRLRTVGMMPRLSHHFESSVNGLFFAGNISGATFGPLMRFVYGCEFAAERISRSAGS